MKYIEEYLKDVIKVEPLGELTTMDDELYGMSGEMVYIDGKCSNIFISHADYVNWLEKQDEKNPVPDWMPKFLDELRLKKNYFDWDGHKDIEGSILAIIKWMTPNYFNEKDGEPKPADETEPTDYNSIDPCFGKPIDLEEGH